MINKEDIICETDRLYVVKFRDDDIDAQVIYDIFNQEQVIRYIGDRGLRTLELARAYVRNIINSYTVNGYGMMHVIRKEDHQSLGTCGLVKRKWIAREDEVNIGYALRKQFEHQGYTIEATKAIIQDGQTRLGISNIVGTTVSTNIPSIKVLEKLGLVHKLDTADDVDPTELLSLYVFPEYL
ncbi:hypothetical protein DFA_09886 [Cavenderia fasciculata]|uniref:N-acetyltransferase domain-containing protein n=1 Tax=Cavenderia fasciculata TaxID=261658 RepID=F4Q8P4_CACFS|nr:uncharacterized protein DFA_09886 [Cavenderia fasciculata]EGG15063.1 hypothetical protein DFA_09886 [Cavenderia fasciculata]|eukprot:XP_004351783.1 hypothetical protein DFA_09886 [Cavenderia fasciculata]